MESSNLNSNWEISSVESTKDQTLLNNRAEHDASTLVGLEKGVASPLNENSICVESQSHARLSTGIV